MGDDNCINYRLVLSDNVYTTLANHFTLTRNMAEVNLEHINVALYLSQNVL